MRKIDYLVVHCTATPQTATIEGIRRYWREECGWRNPGYHYLIAVDGSVVALHPEPQPANGVAGHNAHAVHVSYVGGIDACGNPHDNRTDAQKTALAELLAQLRGRYPGAEVCGHRDFPGVRKSCPSFDARAEYRGL